MEEDSSNPYRPPDEGERLPETRKSGISSVRYAVNLGCGLMALIVMIPLIVIMVIDSVKYRLVPALLPSILLTLGIGRSIWWARRARHTNETH